MADRECTSISSSQWPDKKGLSLNRDFLASLKRNDLFRPAVDLVSTRALEVELAQYAYTVNMHHILLE